MALRKVRMMKREKECWEIFCVPEVTKSECLDDENTVKLIFYCEKTNSYMNVYYQKDENIDYKILSGAMNSALSLCLHCNQRKSRNGNEDIRF